MRKVKSRDPLEPEKIDEMIRRAKRLRDKAFIAFLYMTGARISEVVRLITKRDFKVEDGYLVVKVKTEKNRKQAFRFVPLPLKSRYTMLVRRYLNSVENYDVPLWSFSRQYALKLLKKLGGKDVFPHLFRHTRLTHLVEYGDMNEFELTSIAGWSDPRPAKDYVHLRWKPYAPKVDRAERAVSEEGV